MVMEAASVVWLILLGPYIMLAPIMALLDHCNTEGCSWQGVIPFEQDGDDDSAPKIE